MIGRLHVLVENSDLARQVLAGGTDTLQIRIKEADDATRLAISRSIADLCATARTDCMVNDRADIALAVNATGVHLGANDLPVDVVRSLFGPELIIGGTARTPATALALEKSGANYLGVGPVYQTSSKTGLPDLLGLDRLRAIAESVTIPVIAIGGITAERLPEVLDTGVYGIAVIAAISQAEDPTTATKELMRILATHHGREGVSKIHKAGHQQAFRNARGPSGPARPGLWRSGDMPRAEESGNSVTNDDR